MFKPISHDAATERMNQLHYGAGKPSKSSSSHGKSSTSSHHHHKPLKHHVDEHHSKNPHHRDSHDRSKHSSLSHAYSSTKTSIGSALKMAITPSVSVSPTFIGVSVVVALLLIYAAGLGALPAVAVGVAAGLAATVALIMYTPFGRAAGHSSTHHKKH